ncbi:glycosyltransferase family 4 protein [Pseudoduganella sp. LjRoot289]|uniref:glycosyltransferase family 4 protein n=1 Tax=Pseudoduganella sp. LjRoot289 TaxID=3342314 RepID=UPI003ED064C5
MNTTKAGAARRILMIGTGLDAHGGISSVVRSYVAVRLFEQWGVTYVSTYEGKGLATQLRTMGAALLRAGAMLAARRVSVLHVHSASRGSFWRKSLMCALADLFRVPYVFHLHSSEFPLFYARECGAPARAWVRRVLRRAARVVVVSPHWRAGVLAIEPAARITVVGNPVQVPPALPALRAQAVTVLFMGRVHEKKGVLDLVRAMPAVLAALPGTRFVVAGDGATREVQALAEELGVAHALSLPGWVDGAAKQRHLEQADVFVLPSYFEALSVALLEAMAAGVPVVSTPVGGTPDFIDSGVEGLLVEPGDHGALALALLAVLGDPALRSRLRGAAYLRVGREYAFDTVLAQLRTVYAELGTPLDAPELARAA